MSARSERPEPVVEGRVPALYRDWLVTESAATHLGLEGAPESRFYARPSYARKCLAPQHWAGRTWLAESPQ